MTDNRPAHTPIKTVKILFIACLVLSLLNGCAGIAGRSRVDQFSSTHKSYKWALESGNYRGAAKFIDPSTAKQPVDVKRYANIKVSKYTITGVIISEDRRSIQQDVELQYFLLDQSIVKTTLDRQVWEYREPAQVWLLKTGLPVFSR